MPRLRQIVGGGQSASPRADNSNLHNVPSFMRHSVSRYIQCEMRKAARIVSQKRANHPTSVGADGCELASPDVRVAPLPLSFVGANCVRPGLSPTPDLA